MSTCMYVCACVSVCVCLCVRVYMQASVCVCSCTCVFIYSKKTLATLFTLFNLGPDRKTPLIMMGMSVSCGPDCLMQLKLDITNNKML